MPTQNHGGRPRGGPRAPSTPYNSEFNATYDPSGLQTSTVWGGGPGGRGGRHGGGGWGESDTSFDPSALMDLVYGYKQRGADADLARREKTEREARHRASLQAGALQNNAVPQRDPALNAAIMRAQAQHNSVITAVPFNPAGAIADYYQYSRGGK